MENNLLIEINKKLKESKDISTTFPDKSYAMCKEVYHIAKKNNLKLEEGYALVGMSQVCRAKSENNKMLDYAYSALEIFEELQEVLGQIRSINLIGIAYFYNSMYEQALKYFMQALYLLEEYKDNFLLSCVLNNLGEVFRESMKYNIALEYYNRALKTCAEANSIINTATLLSNIGEIYFLENQNNKAMEYFIKSYEILVNEKDMVALGEVENRLGKGYYVNDNYSKAEEYLISALSRLDSIDNKFYAIDVLINLAKLQSEKDWNASLYYLEKAMQYAEKTYAKKKLSVVYKTAADCHEKRGYFQEALEYYKKYHSTVLEITASIVGNKFEIFKIELDHLNINHKFETIEIINQRLEMEILNQRNELEKIQKINEILEEKAFEDELTHVANRRYINMHLNKIWEEYLLDDQIIVVFMIDIDNFKKYNDHWGHIEGDKCLIKVANCLKDIQVMRKDVFGRYGGEEFIYYAKNISYEEALELGDLFRTEVEKLDLNYTLENKCKVLTISVGGVFGKSSNFENISSMIQIADKELYKAKNMGRNITLVNRMME